MGKARNITDIIRKFKDGIYIRKFKIHKCIENQQTHNKKNTKKKRCSSDFLIKTS